MPVPQWVRELNADEFRTWDDATKKKRVSDGHQALQDENRKMQEPIANVAKDSDLGLHYGWKGKKGSG